MNRQVFRLVCFAFLITTFSSKNICENNLESKLEASSCSCENLKNNEQERFFWGDNKQTLDIKVLVEVVDKILKLVNYSLNLKITSDIFKITLTQLCEEVKNINIDLDSKKQLQDRIDFLIKQLPKYSKANQPDIVILSEILDKLTLPLDK